MEMAVGEPRRPGDPVEGHATLLARADRRVSTCKSKIGVTDDPRCVNLISRKTMFHSMPLVERYRAFMDKIIKAEAVVSTAAEKRDVAESVLLRLCAHW